MRCSRDIQMQKNDNVTNKALRIESDANGFVRPHRDCAMVMDSLQFNSMSRLKTVFFSCELNTPQDNGSTVKNLQLVIDSLVFIKSPNWRSPPGGARRSTHWIFHNPQIYYNIHNLLYGSKVPSYKILSRFI